ncbi:MAG TPA: bifunctional 5,10-methylenetetrahydrofolate dehydrogenase/5,10-methenyltetrahydrofolate cyclohydrolase [Patescibacteria group bacterium]|jgi:methylenetetrahydrofolate dehydrogenase (NADP+)/methenyltetrahydrofolate cyclohydrolase|nr:bifunctional 5,10-methylenetetrahydrofolate dehydrogenase/5,10-methenyltetrahydrofolate cyclohydrolase [Patescibacteria group bacterium]
MEIVDGNQIARKILLALKKQIEQLNLKPHLAVILAGSDPASLTYIRKKQEAAQFIGVKFSLYRFPATIKLEELSSEIRTIQAQPLSGIIVQLPLPDSLPKRQVLNLLNPEIDVDYLSWESLGKLVIGENPLIPPTPGAVLEVLDYYKLDLSGKHIVLVGAGELIGKPLANLLIQMPVTLTVCTKQTKDLAKHTLQADVLVSGVGKYNLIRGNMVKKGAAVIDAGVSFRNKKMHGDVNFEEVKKKASIITPTPGGIGPITVAKLLENTVTIAKQQKSS